MAMTAGFLAGHPSPFLRRRPIGTNASSALQVLPLGAPSADWPNVKLSTGPVTGPATVPSEPIGPPWLSPAGMAFGRQNSPDVDPTTARKIRGIMEGGKGSSRWRSPYQRYPVRMMHHRCSVKGCTYPAVEDPPDTSDSGPFRRRFERLLRLKKLSWSELGHDLNSIGTPRVSRWSVDRTRKEFDRGYHHG